MTLHLIILIRDSKKWVIKVCVIFYDVFRKLWPGEYGCQVDEECSSRCPNTYCEKRKTDKKVDMISSAI